MSRVSIAWCAAEYLRRPSSCRPTDCRVCRRTTRSDFIYSSRIPTAPPVDPFKSYPLMVQFQPLCKKVSIRHTHPRDAGALSDLQRRSVAKRSVPSGKQNRRGFSRDFSSSLSRSLCFHHCFDRDDPRRNEDRFTVGSRKRVHLRG